MSKIVQEKFQVNEPQNTNDDAHSGWVSDKSARDNNGLITRHPELGRFEKRGARLNMLPPGANIDDQEIADIHAQPMGGCLGSGTQVTDDVTVGSLKAGFDRKPLRPTDDQYTREHNDAFYDTVEVDGVEGFVERNNMLDRM
jgi:hypothetical protein